MSDPAQPSPINIDPPTSPQQPKSPTVTTSPRASRTQEKEKQKAAVVPPPRPPTPPQAVTEAVASQALRHFLVAQLKSTGFASATVPVLDELEHVLLQYLMQMYTLARDYAQVSNRFSPNARDMLVACADNGITVDHLRRLARRKRRTGAAYSMLSLLPTPAPQPPPAFLPSDSSDGEDDAAGDQPSTNVTTSPSAKKKAKAAKGTDAAKDGKPPSKKGAADTTGAPATKPTAAAKAKEAGSVLPRTLHSIPKHMPSLPPKHTYLHSAAPPPPTRTLASLESAFQNSLLVQESLRTLVQGTADPPSEPVLLPNGQRNTLDGKVPPTLEESVVWSGLVNFESVERTGGVKRKRWRV